MIKKILRFLVLLLFFTAIPLCTSNEKEFTVWIGGAPQEIDFWQKLVDEYNEKTGDNVILVRQPTYTDQRLQSLVVSLEAEQKNPDLFLMDVVWVDQFIKSGWLEPLNKYFGMKDISDIFFSSVIHSIDEYKGRLYALPVFMDIGLLYSRIDLLKKYGYDQPPKTWNDFIKEAESIQKRERVSNKDFYGYVWQGAQYEGLVCTFLEFISSYGGSIIKNGKINLNSAENIHALTFMRDLLYKYKISPRNTYTEMKEEEVRRSFQNGNALFERNWTYAWNLAQSNNSPVKEKTAISPLPHKEGFYSTSALGGWHIGMSKYSDVKNKAWNFIKYITSFEVQKKLLLAVGWNPGRKDIYQDSVLLRQIPRLKILYDVFKSAVARPKIPYYTQVSEVIQRYVNNCLADKISPESALYEMQNEIDRITEIYENK